MTGALEPNDTLMKAELLARGQVHGPEDTAVDSQGRVYAGLHDGRIVRVLADDSLETFADTGGRPLGMNFDASGNLIVADAYKGLLSIDPQGAIKVLTTGLKACVSPSPTTWTSPATAPSTSAMRHRASNSRTTCSTCSRPVLTAACSAMTRPVAKPAYC